MDLGEESSNDEASPVWEPCGTYCHGQTQSDPDDDPHAESTSHSRDDQEDKKSQMPNAMKECMALAQQMLPELVEESTASQSQQSNLSIMLGLAKKMQGSHSSRFKSPGLVAENLARKMDNLKGFAPSEDATGAEAPLRPVTSLLKPATRKWKTVGWYDPPDRALTQCGAPIYKDSSSLSRSACLTHSLCAWSLWTQQPYSGNGPRPSFR